MNRIALEYVLYYRTTKDDITAEIKIDLTLKKRMPAIILLVRETY